MKAKIWILSLVLVFGKLYAQDEKQCGGTENPKALKAYQDGTNKKYKKEERLDFLKKAIEMDENYADAQFAYAMERIKTLIYQNTAFKPTEPYFKKVLELCPQYHSNCYYYLGFIYYEEENWAEATKYIKQFLDFKSDDDNKFDKNYDALLGEAKQMHRYAKVYAELMNNKVPFEPKQVSDICTERDEYLPIISPDDETMYFTRRVPYVSKNLVYQSDAELEVFSYSKRNGYQGKFAKGVAMPPPFNLGNNEGGATISIDNKRLFFTICKDEGGTMVNCDIYSSNYVNGEWTKPQKVPGINDPIYWDSQPTLASDGKTLYFASDRKGGRGGVDLYITTCDEKTGVWSTPANLGRTINTGNDEKSPFIHSDFQTLYFSSDGHPGVGGFDIFYSRKNDKEEWQEPKNIGIPINTNSDDLGFFVSTDGHLGYFASNQRSRVKGANTQGYDIFSFELYKEARPDEVAFVRGKVEDATGNQTIKTEVEIKDAVTKKVTKAVVDSSSGEYAAVVNQKIKNDLIVTVKKEGYAFSSQLLVKDSIKNAKPITAALQVDTIKIGQTYRLNNIYYQSNSAILESRSLIVIQEFAAFLKANASLKIEIHGHTDNVGNEKANLALSADRAFTVRDALLANGIAEDRIKTFKGFGSSKPLADNSTDDGRAKNRRTEFAIVER
jgi:outer membrane protein OmpA-like peptidoglycan-associated protein